MPAEAVIYSSNDYASFARRVASCLVDMMVVILLLVAVYLAFVWKYVPHDVLSMKNSLERDKQIALYLRPVVRQTTVIYLGVIFMYLIVARTSRGGTLGYRLMGMRLVDAAGHTPGLWPIIKRLLINFGVGFLAMIPFAIFVAAGQVSSSLVKLLLLFASIGGFVMLSYSACRGHCRRQSLHDRWGGTWLVRKAARPLGPAVVRYHTRFMGTFPLRYQDVEAAPVSDAATSEEPAAVARPLTVSPPPISADAR